MATFVSLLINDNSALTLEYIVYGKGGFACLLVVFGLLCFTNLLCYARKFVKGVVLLYSLELAQCRLMGFAQM